MKPLKTQVLTPEVTMRYWKEDDFWLGQIKNHPQFVTQGRTLGELQEMILDLYQLMVEDERNGVNAFYEALRTHNYPCKMRMTQEIA